MEMMFSCHVHLKIRHEINHSERCVRQHRSFKDVAGVGILPYASPSWATFSSLACSPPVSGAPGHYWSLHAGPPLFPSYPVGRGGQWDTSADTQPCWEVWKHKTNHAHNIAESKAFCNLWLFRFSARLSTWCQLVRGRLWESEMRVSLQRVKALRGWGFTDYFHLMVPFAKLAYLSNLTLHNNHFLTEIKSKSPANTEIKMIFHHKLIQTALLCTSAVRIPGRQHKQYKQRVL